MTEHSNLYPEPVIHDTRNQPLGLSFTETQVMIELADGRVLGVPLNFFPLLGAAWDEQRHNYQLRGLTIYWEDIVDGMDVTALLSGLYIEPSKEYLESLQEIVARRNAAAAT